MPASSGSHSSTALKFLALDFNQVTDKGLDPLKGMAQLRGLSLGRTKVTRTGLKSLQKALPQTRIGM